MRPFLAAFGSTMLLMGLLIYWRLDFVSAVHVAGVLVAACGLAVLMRREAGR